MYPLINMIDRTGMRFGRLVVVGFDHRKTTREKKKKEYRYFWKCLCDCGKEKTVDISNLTNGSTQSCGCLRVDRLSLPHGFGGTRIHKIWYGIIHRCTNPKAQFYSHYGGRGITVCKEWEDSFENFYVWAINNGYAEDLTIERVDNDGDYSPDNCTWIPLGDQAENRRNTIKTEVRGKLMTIRDISKVYGINQKTVGVRYWNGDRGEDLIRPTDTRFHGRWVPGGKVYATINGKPLTSKEISKEYGLSLSTIYNRYYRGNRDEELIRPSKTRERKEAEQ